MPLSIGFSNFEDQKFFLEIKLSLLCGYIIDLVKLLIFDADDGGPALGLVFAEGLHLDGLAFNEDADAIIGYKGISFTFDAITPADDFVLFICGC